METGFSAGFGRVNHQGTLDKLCFVGIGISVLSIWTQFLSNLCQQVIVDCGRINLVYFCLECSRRCFGSVIVL